jgi:hypothetical protein
MQVVSALSSASISRLKLTWALIPAKVMEALEELRLFVSASNNFSSLRSATEERMGTIFNGVLSEVIPFFFFQF